VGQVSPPSSSRGIFLVNKLTTTIIEPLTPKMMIAEERKEETFLYLTPSTLQSNAELQVYTI